jgi:hypothetical protein
MKRLREMIFDNSSSEEEEGDGQVEMAMVVILNNDYRWTGLGS